MRQLIEKKRLLRELKSNPQNWGKRKRREWTLWSYPLTYTYTQWDMNYMHTHHLYTQKQTIIIINENFKKAIATLNSSNQIALHKFILAILRAIVLRNKQKEKKFRNAENSSLMLKCSTMYLPVQMDLIVTT